MIEAAMVFDLQGYPLYWRGPDGCGFDTIEDSRTLWEVLWENRCRLGGVAHTHPWKGKTSPSHTDVTTFAAVEAGIGRRLLWPIVTMTHVNYFVHANWWSAADRHPDSQGPLDYRELTEVWDWHNNTHWLSNFLGLRQLSGG